MKIMINRAGCVGHARCATVAPELFTLDDEGYIATASIDVPVGLEVVGRRGAKLAPNASS